MKNHEFSRSEHSRVIYGEKHYNAVRSSVVGFKANLAQNRTFPHISWIDLDSLLESLLEATTWIDLDRDLRGVSSN